MLKRLLEDNSGISYSLEAILGVSLIIGTMIYLTAGLPHTSQNAEEYSRVQLMNIGRDTLDLMAITPVSDLNIALNNGTIGDTCVDINDLNMYLNNYMPAMVDYNLYLIGTDGKKFTGCPGIPEGQLINGYPTNEAVTVNKLAHINSTTINKILELRMVLWYK
jgi:hypothetical protein